jgi:aspartyl protease family protein
MADVVASFGYLAVLLLAVGGWWMASNRPSIGKTLQMALVWGMIFMGGMAIYGLWNDISNDYYSAQIISSDGEITIPRASDGH